MLEGFEVFPEIPDDDIEITMNFKIVFIGDSGVGKTNLLFRLSKDKFLIDSKPTVGVDFFNKTVKHQGKYIRIQVWDTAGQERYKSFVSAYFKECRGIFLVYDITSKESFLNLSKWMTLMLNQTKLSEVPVIIIGNKNDLENKREVSTEEGKDFARKHGMKFIETSAYLNSNNNVFEAMKILLDDIRIKYDAEVQEFESEMAKVNINNIQRLDESSEKEKKGCC